MRHNIKHGQPIIAWTYDHIEYYVFYSHTNDDGLIIDTDGREWFSYRLTSNFNYEDVRLWTDHLKQEISLLVM